MKTDVLIFIDKGLSDEDLTFGGSFTPDSLSGKLSSLDAVTDVYFSVPEDYSGALSGRAATVVRSGEDDVDFWKKLLAATSSDHVIKIHGDSPFLDPQIVSEMADIHIKYLAEFTYSENLPEGMTCEIVSRELVDAIPEFNEKTLPLSKVVRSNMNQFDIELYYRDPDVRDKRLSFRASDPRERRVMENIAGSAKGTPAYGQIRELIERNPGVLYIGPSYLEIELTGRCDLDCLFCYRTKLDKKRDDLSAELFGKILSDMKDFALPYTICLGGSGEPLMNPQFYAILEQAEAEPLVRQVIVETNGIQADGNYRNHVAGSAPGKIKTIVNINGHNTQTYSQLHGSDHYDEVVKNITSLKESLSGRGDDALHVQIMKINETEPFLDSYYDYWEKQGVPIILQKQNTYTGLVQDRRYSDLSPLERVPCWHLQRDLFILSDGSVPFCRVDVRESAGRGNVRDLSLREIWEQGKAHFISDYRRSYASCPDCAACDEWYTFNF
ncbi:MAG TPA: spiro-SPASM protein [Spirochaetota bacterium]|nr:spiro-SPASM protein [Spirochaetota bacterium]HPI87945.1 spiro-SPASM protein [Spirochaetota bacterium]HPR46655.1 spiro-SPASM protein [Spirochaetota bacterium]